MASMELTDTLDAFVVCLLVGWLVSERIQLMSHGRSTPVTAVVQSDMPEEQRTTPAESCAILAGVRDGSGATITKQIERK